MSFNCLKDIDKKIQSSQRKSIFLFLCMLHISNVFLYYLGFEISFRHCVKKNFEDYNGTTIKMIGLHTWHKQISRKNCSQCCSLNRKKWKLHMKIEHESRQKWENVKTFVWMIWFLRGISNLFHWTVNSIKTLVCFDS